MNNKKRTTKRELKSHSGRLCSQSFKCHIECKLIFLFYLKRCSLIEPGPVATSFVANAREATDPAEVDNPSVDEETKQLLENCYKKMLTSFTTVVQSGDEVAQVILEALIADKPHLRYQTNKNYASATAAKLADPTGDKPMDLSYQRFFV